MISLYTNPIERLKTLKTDRHAGIVQKLPTKQMNKEKPNTDFRRSNSLEALKNSVDKNNILSGVKFKKSNRNKNKFLV